MIGNWIRKKAERNGDRIALEIAGETRTYNQLDANTDRTAAGFAALGLNQGDKACLMMRNSVANVEAWLGLCKAGVIEVPINTANKGYLLEYIIRQSDARAIVCDPEFLPRLEEIEHALEHVIVGDLPDGPVPRPTLRPRDTSVILYTSGTTGPSKGVVLSHNANLALARSTVELMRYGRDDVLYTVFPLFHINAKYTSVMAALEADARLVMEDKFSASRYWDTCRTKGVTAFNYQGALLLMLFKQPPRDDDAENPVRVGFGAPCPADLWEPFEERFGVRLVDVYGMTEIAIATANSLVVRPAKPDILISEYYKQEQATIEAFRNLWFHTGDRGRMDADGYLTFIDRMKDAIRRRGENVSSWEVEQVVNAHDDVLDELPRTPSQRLQKYKLRDAGVTADMWDASVRS